MYGKNLILWHCKKIFQCKRLRNTKLNCLNCFFCLVSCEVQLVTPNRQIRTYWPMLQLPEFSFQHSTSQRFVTSLSVFRPSVYLSTHLPTRPYTYQSVHNIIRWWVRWLVELFQITVYTLLIQTHETTYRNPKSGITGLSAPLLLFLYPSFKPSSCSRTTSTLKPTTTKKQNEFLFLEPYGRLVNFTSRSSHEPANLKWVIFKVKSQQICLFPNRLELIKSFIPQARSI